jgi:hypothetical protein
MKMIWFEVLIIGAVIGFLNGFLLSLLVKWEVVFRFDYNMRKRNSPTRFCFFCVSFWMAVAYTLVYLAHMGSFRPEFIFAVPVATMIGVFVRIPYDQ